MPESIEIGEVGMYIIVVLFVFLTIVPLSAMEEAEKVLVVINDNSPASVQIGEYYKNRRNIPESNICHYSGSAAERVNAREYKNLVTAIQSWITANNLNDKISYIVLTKGTPLGYKGPADGPDGDGATIANLSVCSMLATMLYTRKSEKTDLRNPYYGKDEPFSSQKAFSGRRLYLVTRLDGYTVDQVIGLIDNSFNAVPQKGDFLFDCQNKSGGYKWGDDQMKAGAESLGVKGYEVILDTTTAFQTGYSGLMGYFSWGSNAGGNYSLSKWQNNHFLPGSLAESYVSTSGRTFNLPANWPNYTGQSLMADLVINGITGLCGYTNEPLLGCQIRPATLFDRYTKGYNLAESFWMANPNVSWQHVIVGDPLCAPYPYAFKLPDTTRPAAVTNLSAAKAATTIVLLTWSAPGDDGSTGTAAGYDIRYSTSAITEANWASATQVTGEPVPGIAGSSQSMFIRGLKSFTTYYFAMKASDEVPNLSGLSNIVSVTTPDITAPTKPGVLAIRGRKAIIGYWGSYDPESGIVEYQYRIIRNSTAGPVIRDWTSTGIRHYALITGLSFSYGNTYSVAVRAKNGAGLWSNVGYSNAVLF